MKKSIIKCVVFIFLISTVISGCSLKDSGVTILNNEQKEELYNFMFDYTNNVINHKSSGYLPNSFLIELNRYVLKNGRPAKTFNLIYPNKVDVNEYNNIYDCHSDNGDWVESIIFAIEEERIGVELEKMDDFMASENLIQSNEVMEAEKEKAEEIFAQEVIDPDDNLSYMEYGKEIFMPQKKGSINILIHAFEGNVTRSFYDNLFRCFKEEKWKIDSSGNEDLIKTVSIEYDGTSYIPIEKEISLGKSSSNHFYNDKGLLINETNYSFINDNKIIQSETNLKYNNERQVIESSVDEYHYDENGQLLFIFNKKYLYEYNGDDIPPNFDYYEDENLKMKNLYTSKDSYTSEIYFDNDFSVITYYEKGKKKKEVFNTNNGKERIKEYE